MWKIEHPIAPGFEWRLKIALDRVTPPSGLPRYAMSKRTFRPLRPALATALAVSVTVLLALSATAATGSANPVVWSERAVSTIQAVSHLQEPPPTQAPVPQRTVKTAPAPAPEHSSESTSASEPEPTDRPEHSPRPTPTAEHSGANSPHESPKPPVLHDDN
jgi:hypothetical protein